MSTLVQNLRFAARSLLRSPGFFLVTVLTLALGIGTNTAIFSIVNAMLLRPYPYADPERLVMLRSINPRAEVFSGELSYPDFFDLRAQSRMFEEIGAVRLRRSNLTGSNEPVRVKGAQVSATLFQLLGGRPLLGRGFTAADDQPGAEPVAVLSEPLWRRSFGADPSIVGKAIRIDGRPITVVGVIPPSAHFPDTDAAELFIPFAMSPTEADRGSRAYMVLGRLKPGVSVAQAAAEVGEISQRLAADHSETNESWGVRLVTLRDYRTQRFRSLFLILLGVVGLVLLIACVNVAHLLLQRATVRRREIAIRLAIGAGRSHIVAQLLVESVVIALLGGACGLLLSSWGLRLVVRSLPDTLPSYMNNFGIDIRVLAFLFVVSLLTAVLFGLAPALQTSKANVTETLGDSGTRSSGGAKVRRVRSALVVVEVALSMVLLIAAGLMVKSFLRLQNVDPGFQPKGALTMAITFSSQYREPGRKSSFLQALIENLGTLPGAQAAAVTDELPIGRAKSIPFKAEGQTIDQSRDTPEVNFQVVGGDYFRALGIPVIKGRPFDARDFVAGSPPVVIVNDTMARQIWPGQDPLGKRIQVALEEETWVSVVGVAADVKARAFARGRVAPEIYLPHPLLPDFNTLDVVVRTAGDPVALISSVKTEIRKLDPELPLEEICTVEQAMAESFWVERLSSTLFSVFAAIALLLAVVGIYGTMAYSVTQRRREIGIRLALGARAVDVVRMIVRQGMAPVILAMVLGLAGAVAIGRVLRRLLFEVRATDPATFLGVSVLIVAVALLASYIPARRATRIPPDTVLRTD